MTTIDTVELEARADALLARFVEPGGPGAAVAVLRDGAFVLRKGYGLAQIEWSIPMTPDAVFRICSLTKQFTAVAVMMLAQRGLIDIDAPLERYLPDWPARGRMVTVGRLLNHTSGVWRHDSELPERTRRTNPSVEEVLAMIHDRPLEFEPGERYVYNNSGYLLLGAVIEAVSGATWDDFLRREVFLPLGMRNTGVLRHGTITPLRAQGYIKGRSGFHNARLDAMNWSGPAGALGSTINDLTKWDRALRENRLIRAETLERMLEPTRLNDGSFYPYGFGWGAAEFEGRRIYHHTGGVSGFACQLLSFRDEDVTTIVLSNLSMFPFDAVTRGLMRAALDLDEVQAPKAALSASLLAACAGAFKTPDVPVRTLAVKDGGLVFVEQNGARLVAATDGVFRDAADLDIEYRFSEVRDGVFRRMEWASPLWPSMIYERVGPDDAIRAWSSAIVATARSVSPRSGVSLVSL